MGDTSGAAAGAVTDFYAHQTAPTYFGANVLTGNPAGQPTGGTLANALSKAEGSRQADEAAKALEDDPFLKIGPFSI